MAHSKQGKTTAKGAVDGRHRKETKEERRLRLQRQEEARQKCLKLLPYAGGFLLVFVILFTVYVRTAAPRRQVVAPVNATASRILSDLKSEENPGDDSDLDEEIKQQILKAAQEMTERMMKKEEPNEAEQPETIEL